MSFSDRGAQFEQGKRQSAIESIQSRLDASDGGALTPVMIGEGCKVFSHGNVWLTQVSPVREVPGEQVRPATKRELRVMRLGELARGALYHPSDYQL